MCQWHPSFSFCASWRRTKRLGMQSRGELPLGTTLGKISFPNAFPFFLREGSNAATSLQAPGTQRLQLLFSGAQGTPKCMYCHTHRSEIMQFSNHSKQLIIRGRENARLCWMLAVRWLLLTAEGRALPKGGSVACAVLGDTLPSKRHGWLLTAELTVTRGSSKTSGAGGSRTGITQTGARPTMDWPVALAVSVGTTSFLSRVLEEEKGCPSRASVWGNVFLSTLCPCETHLMLGSSVIMLIMH